MIMFSLSLSVCLCLSYLFPFFCMRKVSTPAGERERERENRNHYSRKRWSKCILFQSPSPSMSTVSCPEYPEFQEKLHRLAMARDSLSVQVIKSHASAEAAVRTWKVRLSRVTWSWDGTGLQLLKVARVISGRGLHLDTTGATLLSLEL